LISCVVGHSLGNQKTKIEQIPAKFIFVAAGDWPSQFEEIRASAAQLIADGAAQTANPAAIGGKE